MAKRGINRESTNKMLKVYSNLMNVMFGPKFSVVYEAKLKKNSNS